MAEPDLDEARREGVRPPGGRLRALGERGHIAYQVPRFVVVAGVVAVLYLATMAIGTEVAGLHTQVALAIAYAVAIASHFVLNRTFVFRHQQGFQHRTTMQGARYALLVVVGYGITALAVGTLPAALDVPDLPVFVVVALLMAPVNFVVLRLFVFRRRRRSAG